MVPAGGRPSRRRCVHARARVCVAPRRREIAPHYYDLSNFPQCEAKSDLESAYRIILAKQKADAKAGASR